MEHVVGDGYGPHRVLCFFHVVVSSLSDVCFSSIGAQIASFTVWKCCFLGVFLRSSRMGLFPWPEPLTPKVLGEQSVSSDTDELHHLPRKNSAHFET